MKRKDPTPALRRHTARRRSLAALATVLTHMSAYKALAVTYDSWTYTNSGTWDTNSNWSLGVAPVTTSYNAVIAQAANPYTVNIVDNISPNSITLNSTDATILQTAGTVTTSAFTVEAGTFELDGGTLANAAVTVAGGSFTALQGTLGTVSFAGGDLNVLAMGTLDIQGGLSITEHNLVLGSISTTCFDGSSSTLSALNVAPSSNYAIIDVGGANFTGSSTLTIAANTFVSGAVEFNDYTLNSGTLINNGSIVADSTVRPTAIADNDFINNGTAQANGGGTLRLAGANFTNNGTLSAANSSTLNLAGTFSTAGLGTINIGSTSMLSITGTINNAGATLKPSGGTWQLSGTINGGTIDESTQPLVINGGTLSGVAIAGADLQVPQQNALYVQGGLTIANHNLDLGYAANLFFDGMNQSIDNLNINTTTSLGVIKLGFTSNGTINLTLNLGSSNTINGPFEIFQNTNALNDTLNNAGTMETNSGTLYVETATFNNNGTLAAGNVTTNGNVTSIGNLEVDALHFVNNGTISLGPDSTLRFMGSNFTENGTLTTSGSVSALNTTVTFASGTVHSTGTLSLTGTSTVSQSVTSTDTLAGPLMLAPTNGDVANYSLGAGTLTCQQSALVGSNGSGTFTQTAGATTITGNLSAGNTGTLTAGSGTGKINISGGTLYADTVLLGSTAGGSGALTVSGSGNVTIGGGAHLNDLTVNGGTVTVLNQAPPADEDHELNYALVGGYLSNGALYVNGGTVKTPEIKLGISSGYTGTFAQTAGTVNVGTLAVGNDASLTTGSGVGSVTISGGSLYVDTLLLGAVATAGGTGALVVSGTGSVTIGGGAHLNDLTVNAGTVTVLAQPAPFGEDPELYQALVGGYRSNGALLVNGGVVTTPYVKLGVTSGDTGTFAQTLGSVSVGTLCVGDDVTTTSGSGTGSVTVSGGSLSVGTLLVGSTATAAGVGAVAISGTGSVLISQVATILPGNTLSLSGGTLTLEKANLALPTGMTTVGNGNSSPSLHLHDSIVSPSVTSGSVPTTLMIGTRATLDGGGSAVAGENAGSVLFSGTNLTLTGGGTLHIALGGDPGVGTNAGKTFDQITEGNGTFTTGGATLQILPLAGVLLNTPYPIVVTTSGGVLNFTQVFANLTTDPSYTAGSVSYTVAYSPVSAPNTIDVTFSSVVPEPASTSAILAASCLLRRRRKNRVKSASTEVLY